MPVHAFIFPGQGSQSLGMGRDLAEAFAPAREVFEEVDDALGERLTRVMWGEDADALTLTANAQPALMAVSLASLRVLEAEGGVRLADRAVLVAGHSLGEYSALAASGAFAVAQAARLLRRRGEAMQAAVAPGIGAMAALLGVELDAAGEICAEAAVVPDAEGGAARTELVSVANDNGGGQVVISGLRGAVERAIAIAKARGVKRAMLLPVSAPFHCALMAPAAEAMEDALAASPPIAPVVPLIANVTAARVQDAGEISALLVRQVTGAVRWRESLVAAGAIGVDSFVELGAGKVLSGLVRRVLPEAQALNAGTPAEIESLLKVL